jgi:hypothetical protein
MTTLAVPDSLNMLQPAKPPGLEDENKFDSDSDGGKDEEREEEEEDEDDEIIIQPQTDEEREAMKWVD